VIFKGDHIEYDLTDRRLARAKGRLRITAAILELEPDNIGFLGLFQGFSDLAYEDAGSARVAAIEVQNFMKSRRETPLWTSDL